MKNSLKIKKEMTSRNVKIISYNKKFKDEEVVVRFPVTGSLKNKVPFLNKTFPRKNFFQEIALFMYN